MRPEYIAELNATVERLNAISQAVLLELGKLGYAASMDWSKSEETKDAMFLRMDMGVNLRATEISYGAKRGRIEWGGYLPTVEGVHYSHRDALPSITHAPDAAPDRVARQIVRGILEAARPSIEKYAARCAEHKAARDALPDHVERVRAMGFECDVPADPAATEAHFYLRGIGSARVNSSGAIYFERLYPDSATAWQMLEAIANATKREG